MIYLTSYPMLLSMVNTALQPSNLVFEQWQEDTFSFCSCGLSEGTEDFLSDMHSHMSMISEIHHNGSTFSKYS